MCDAPPSCLARPCGRKTIRIRNSSEGTGSFVQCPAYEKLQFKRKSSFTQTTPRVLVCIGASRGIGSMYVPSRKRTGAPCALLTSLPCNCLLRLCGGTVGGRRRPWTLQTCSAQLRPRPPCLPSHHSVDVEELRKGDLTFRPSRKTGTSAHKEVGDGGNQSPSGSTRDSQGQVKYSTAKGHTRET